MTQIVKGTGAAVPRPVSGEQSWFELDRREDPLAHLETLGAIRAYHRGQEIYGREDPAEHWYRIVFGVARKCALLADGRRQIVDFLLPGNFFGFAARPNHPA